MWHWRSPDDEFWHVYGSSAQAELREALLRGRPSARVVLEDGTVVDVNLLKLQHVGLHSEKVCPVRYVPAALPSPRPRPPRPAAVRTDGLTTPPSTSGRFSPQCTTPLCSPAPLSPVHLPPATSTGLSAEALTALVGEDLEDPFSDSHATVTQASIRLVTRWLESLERDAGSGSEKDSCSCSDVCSETAARSEALMVEEPSAPALEEGEPSPVSACASASPRAPVLEVTKSISSTASSWFNFSPRILPAEKLLSLFGWGTSAEP